MMKLAILADDFTGAMDTGIKFAKDGVRVQMILEPGFSPAEIRHDCPVLVIDTETRHLPHAQAYETVYKIARQCIRCGVEYLYKKTDSALRGCVGSELAALMDATHASVQFVPALPEENRTTSDGVHYINRVPVSHSIFGVDPFDPVRHSRVADIIHEGTDKRVVNVKTTQQWRDFGDACIVVYDASTVEDMQTIARILKREKCLRVTAGCAGFAACLREVMDFPRKSQLKIAPTRSLFVACGSINAITVRQLDYAERHGFWRIHLNLEQRLRADYFDTVHARAFLKSLEAKCRSGIPVILDSPSDLNDDVSKFARAELRGGIARRIGEFVRHWLLFGLEDTVLLTGGDTAFAFLSQITCNRIEPVCEIVPGAIVFNIYLPGRKLQAISKSGGFGDERMLTAIASKLGIHP